MSLWRHLTRGARALISRRADADADAEIQHFLDETAAGLEAEGLSPGEARRAARVRVGNPLAMREAVRTSGWEHLVETFAADVRYALRRVRRHPGFAGVAVATLGLGIGTATVMLSVAGPVLVPTLPYPESDRIRAVWDQSQDGVHLEMAFGSFVELQERSRSFTEMAVVRRWQPAITGSDVPERLEGQAVSTDYFRVFAMPPRIGRDFEAGDDRPGAPRVAIVSDRLWHRRFGADPAIVGRRITLDGSAYDVVGVMPASFEHRLMPRVDVWRPLQYDRTSPSFDGREWGHHLRMVARLCDGVTPDAAAIELARIAREPDPRFARPSWAAMPRGLLVESLHEDLTRQAAPVMRAVLAAAALLLLIACVNVVNLLLGRDAQRRSELALRTALGAPRGRVVRQLVTETLVLVALGGVVGLLVAAALVRGLVRFGPADLPPAAHVSLAAPVFVLALGVTAIVGLVVGLAPAFWYGDPGGGARRGTSWTTAAHGAFRRALVAVEVALALVLLVGAGLLMQSLQHLFAISPGFDARHVLAMQVQVAGPRFADAAVTHRFFRDALDTVKRVPGVADAALTTQLPLGGDLDVYGVRFEAFETQLSAAEGAAFRYAVSPDYFATMRIPVRAGRVLDDRDQADAPLAAVISESLARNAFQDRDPIGQRLHIGPTDRPRFTVVGVVGDVKQQSLEDNWHGAVYVTPGQWHFADNTRWVVVRARADAASLAPAIRDAIWSVNKEQPIVRTSTLVDVVASTARERRFARLLFQAFGVGALLLTAVGIYGVVSGGVTDRVREIGIRTALGASRATVARMVMAQGMAMAVAGIAAGVLGAVAMSRGLATLLFGVSPIDPITYAAVALLLAAVTLLACWLPARRAARIDPAVTLRSE